MDDRIQSNRAVIGLLLGLILFVAWAASRDDAVLAGALLLFIVALVGDRLKKAPGGWEFFRARIAAAVRVEAPPPPSGPAASEFSWGTASAGEVEATHRASAVAQAGVAEGHGAALEGLVAARSQVLAALDSLDTATTPEELAERVVEYVGLRSAPGLRRLSDERMGSEAELFRAVLELQTRRARGQTPQDDRKLASSLERIETFWTRPELLSDQEVADTTVRVQALIEDMRELEG